MHLIVEKLSLSLMRCWYIAHGGHDNRPVCTRCPADVWYFSMIIDVGRRLIISELLQGPVKLCWQETWIKVNVYHDHDYIVYEFRNSGFMILCWI